MTIIDGKEQTVIIDKSYIIGKSFPIHLSGITLRSIKDGRKISRCSTVKFNVIFSASFAYQLSGLNVHIEIGTQFRKQ